MSYGTILNWNATPNTLEMTGTNDRLIFSNNSLGFADGSVWLHRGQAGMAARLYPFTRQNGLDQPKFVVIDPLVSFGRPSIAGTGIATSMLAERYKAGDSMDALADDYGCERAQIEEAVRCELALAA